MESVLRALRLAAVDLFSPPMLLLTLWPMGLALLLWGLLAWLFGAAWQAELAAFLATTPLQTAAGWLGADWLLTYSAFFFLVLLWLPAVYLTAVLITSVVLMPGIVRHVAGRRYPGLQALKGGTLVGGLINSLAALAVFVVAWVLLLPFWLFGPLGALLSVLLNAWLNRRMFVYDALSEHASAAELAWARREGGWPLFAMSALLGLLYLVPLVNFLAPIYMGLAFTHYGLDALRRQRGGAGA
ncbi:MAG TPA: EI24 domain-containing protein [Thiobacillaceae bacterium]|nr:EI24 domain-containing protein [Thiobacillaceae bacterium]